MSRLAKLATVYILVCCGGLATVKLLSVNGFVSAGGGCPEHPTRTATCNGDTNGDTFIDLSDGVYLLQHIFQGGPAPAVINGGPPLSGNTLDAAYDQGGPGAGGVIMADAGPVEIIGADGLLVGDSSATATAFLTVDAPGDFSGNHVASFKSRGSNADGIAIHLANGDTNADNNFVTFYDGDGDACGRIEGYDVQNGDWQDPPPLTLLDSLSDFTFDPGISLSVGSLPTANFNPGSFSGGSLPSLSFSGGSLPSLSFSSGSLPSLTVHFSHADFHWSAGSLPSASLNKGSLPSASLNKGSLPNMTLPSLSFSGGSLPNLSFSGPSIGIPAGITQQIQDLICWALDSGLDGLITTNPFDIALAGVLIAETELCKDGGVTYASQGADYAEWLPKVDPDEKMIFGQIVGVHDGEVSKKTDGADQIMSVSLEPVVVGNLPPEGEESRFAKVSFMGQVPVLVRGGVRSGDYIIPSGKNDGIGIAVAPEDLRLEQMLQVLGRAWSDSERDDLAMVNVLVGVKVDESSEVLKRHAERLYDLEARIAEFDEWDAELALLEARVVYLEHVAAFSFQPY